MTETRAIGDRAIGISISITAFCVAYLYALDHSVISSSGFSAMFRFLLRSDAETAWLEVLICGAALLWNRPAPILRFVDFLSKRAPWVVLFSVALIALGSLGIYHDYPLSMDEYAAVFQAKIFASGHLTARLDPSYVDWMVVRGFNGEFLIVSGDTGRAIAKYWPGFALLLAPFEYLRISWLCNPLLSGFSLLLIHRITSEITHDQRAAGWAILFALGSGAFIADGISYYSMQAHLTANLAFVALLLRPNICRATAAGLLGSLALILHNPVPHALFAIPWLAAIAINPKQRRLLLPLALGYLPGLCLGLSWVVFRASLATTVHPTGFIGITQGVFTWPYADILNIRTASFAKMCVWAVPGLFVFAGLGLLSHRENRQVRLLTASAALTFAAYIFIAFDQGHGWGNRYFHSAWGVIPILAGIGMSNRSQANLRLVSFAGAAAILSLILVIPLQLSQIEKMISSHRAQLAAPRRPGNNVYFVHPRGGFYAADLVQIDPMLRNPDLILVSRGTPLDTEMVLANWPAAVKIGGSAVFDQWYLGADDRRRATGADSDLHFVLKSLAP
jgi:hypothetical protein